MKLVTVTRNFAKYWFAAILAVACTVNEPVETQAPNTSEPVVSTPWLEGEATVVFDDALTALVEQELAGGVATKSASLEARLADLDIESIERLFPYSPEFEQRTRLAGLHRYYLVRFKPDVPATKAAASLRSVQGIVSAEPARKIRPRAAFNDPLFSRQWHYVNNTTPGADINIQGVWDEYTVGSQMVVVSVVDEPIDPTHPDLMANLWTDSQGHTGYNFARGSLKFTNADPGWDLTIRPPASYNSPGDIGHGTHVAGTISAVNNNGTGLCGIAGGDAAEGTPGVRLMSCAIFSGDRDCSDAATARAFKWAADNGAVISQNSWGYPADVDNDGKISSQELSDYKAMTISSSLKDAIDYFIKYAGCDNSGLQLPDSPMKGGLVFFAAGNEDIDYDPICAYEPVIAVGAFNEKGNKASYSNYGNWIDIAAPGGEGTKSASSIWSTLPKNVDGGSSGYGGVGWAGTSMACPHASGVAALIVSYYGQGGFTAADAREILFAGLGKTIGGSTPIGKKIDALASFAYGGYMNEDPLSLGAKEVSVHAHQTRVLHLTVKADPGYTVTCTPGSDALVYDSSTGEVTITGRNAPSGTYKAKFVLISGGAEQFTLNFSYTLLPNHAPEVSLGSYRFDDILARTIGVTMLQNKPADLGILFTDEDGEILTVTVDNSSPEVAALTYDDNKFSILTTGYGLDTVTITATDALGESAYLDFKVAVKNPSKDNVAEVFPEAATDIVNIWPAPSRVVTYDIRVYSSTGAKVLEVQGEGGLFQPIPVDITGLAPGLYTAGVTPKGGNTQKVRFVKY